MGATDPAFDAIGWAARALAWERRLRELEAQGPAELPAVLAERAAELLLDSLHVEVVAPARH